MAEFERLKDSLAALQGNRIIVDGHVTIANQNIPAGIQIDRIRAGGFDRGNGRQDPTGHIFDMVALVKVVCPEGRILKSESAYHDIAAMRKEDQPGPLRILIRTAGVPAPAQIEILPEPQAVSIDCSLPEHGKAIETVRVDQRGKVQAVLAFDPRPA